MPPKNALNLNLKKCKYPRGDPRCPGLAPLLMTVLAWPEISPALRRIFLFCLLILLGWAQVPRSQKCTMVFKSSEMNGLKQ